MCLIDVRKRIALQRSLLTLRYGICVIGQLIRLALKDTYDGATPKRRAIARSGDKAAHDEVIARQGDDGGFARQAQLGNRRFAGGKGRCRGELKRSGSLRSAMVQQHFAATAERAGEAASAETGSAVTGCAAIGSAATGSAGLASTTMGRGASRSTVSSSSCACATAAPSR